MESKENYYILHDGLERYYVSEYDNNKEVGDIIEITGNKKELHFVMIESSFDFKNYLNDKGVYYELEIKQIKTINNTPFRFKAFRNNFLSYFDENIRGVVGNMLFGINNDSFLSTQLSLLHLYRLFNAGGLFVNAFLVFFTFLFKIKFKKEKAKLYSFLLLIPYFILAINKFSVLRIFVLQIFEFINKYKLKGRFNYLELLSLSGIIFLIFDYHLAYQDGFILGYLISLFVYFIANSFSFIGKRKRKILIGLFVFLFFIPFEIEYYHEISLLSPLISLIFMPVFIIINVINLLCLYGLPLSFVSSSLLNVIANLFSSININILKIYSPTMPLYVSFLYETVLVLLFYYRSIRFKPLYILFTYFFMGILLINFLPFQQLYSKKIYFLNVGQGDSTLIINNGKTVLIDTGGNIYKDIAMECLIPFFKKERIYKIDHLIITHEDYDHNGAKNSLIENFIVKNVVAPDDFPLYVGDLEIKNLNPFSNSIDRGENDASYVLSFDFINMNFLLMGDASSKIEKVIINKYPNVDCDIIRVGHHGSSSSSCYEFIQQVTPREAIISCGENNKYNHPSNEVINTLLYFGIKIRRTDIEGTIYYGY